MSSPDRAALQESRPLVMAASLGSGVIGLLPLPLINDLGIGALRALLLQRLADRRGVPLSPYAALVAAGELAPSAERLAVTTALSFGLRLAMRRLGRLLLVLLRLDDVGRTFLLGTCFDHYCLRHHPDGCARRIDAPRAAAFHAAADAALTRTRIQLASALVTRAWTELNQAGQAIPGAFWAACTALLQGSDGEQPAPSGPEGEEARSFLDRVAAAAGRELDAAGELTLTTICQSFDDAWRTHHSRTEELADESNGP